MSMHSGMGPVWRHMRTDRSIAEQKVGRETITRILRFARPHRSPIALFLVLTVVDAALVVVTPLLVKNIVDDGILKKDTELVVLLSLAAAGVAVLDAGLAPGSGWLSPRTAEGLIFDPRTTVFAHVQRISLAFFTRTQTGAL